MNTVPDIILDINRGCLANNLIEDKFRYRLVYFVSEGDKSSKHYVDTPYDGLWEALGNIIRGNLTATNAVIIAAVTVRKNGESISLLNRAYGFDLSGYFRKICEAKEKDNMISFRCGAR